MVDGTSPDAYAYTDRRSESPHHPAEGGGVRGVPGAALSVVPGDHHIHAAGDRAQQQEASHCGEHCAKDHLGWW